MSLLQLNIDPDKFRKYGIRKRQLGQATRLALEEMGRRWWSEFLPLHFDESAYQRYGYYQRKGMGLDPLGRAFRVSTVGRKLRIKGHNRPLVFSGAGMREAIGVLRMRSTTKDARVRLPSKFNFRNRASRISMREEITRILPGEAATLVAYGRAKLRELLARSPGTS